MGLLDNRTGTYQSPMGLLPAQQRRNNTGFPSAYPVPESTPFADFGRGILDAFSYTPDPNKTFMERSFVPLAADMESMISGFDAKGNKVPDTLRMMSLMMPGGTGLGGKAGLGILGAATGAAPKVGSAYVSRLIPTLENMPQDKMSAEQFSGWLNKQPVGADELEYSGIPGLLAQGGDVTKTGLLDQARANPLDIQDVVLSEPYREITKRGNEFQVETDDGYFGPYQTRQEAEEIITELRETGAYGGPKFSDYQLPGGEDYKEMLLTLPVQHAITELPSNYVIKKITNDVARGMGNRPMYGVKELGSSQFIGYKDNKEDAVADALRVINEVQSKTKNTDVFRASHFDEPNVLAHARYNTRTIDGDKTLFIEEIQSDWHQKGRDVGYKTPENIDALSKQLKQTYEKLDFYYEKVKKSGNDLVGSELAEQNSLQEKADKLSDLINNKAGHFNLVPDAPYKRTDKWAGLTLQRMIKEAVDSGHDRIAWTPGKVQAKRYDLSKQLSEIHLSGSNFKAYGLDGEPVIQRTGVTPEDLPELIGKEAADRLMSQKPKAGLRSLIGENLQIGGQGMKEFYDKMLVKSANKFGKKYGAKAQKSTLKTNQGGDVGKSASDLRYYHYDENGIMDTSRSWKTEAEAEAALGETVWSMKITPEMKAGISKGVMLGKSGGEGKVAAGLLQNDEEQMPSGLPMRGLLGGTLYTATTPDGFI
mgnify:CR=1 FL=1